MGKPWRSRFCSDIGREKQWLERELILPEWLSFFCDPLEFFRFFLHAETPFLFFQQAGNFVDKLHELVWVLLRGGLLAENAPALPRFALHNSKYLRNVVG